ncbi:RcnB family protein [Allosphingosinicella humi]|jgi:Ni/Co efflux regulator RcnB
MKALTILISAGATLVSQPLVAQTSAATAAPGVTWREATSAAVPTMSSAEAVPSARAEFRRLERGGQVPQGWLTPRFIIANWALYGFSPPYPGLVWVRYYDDALLIDREGWVHDSRHDIDWARYGESWRTDRGVPEYAVASEPGAGSYAYPDPADGLGRGYGYGLFYVPITITETTTVRNGGRQEARGNSAAGVAR